MHRDRITKYNGKDAHNWLKDLAVDTGKGESSESSLPVSDLPVAENSDEIESVGKGDEVAELDNSMEDVSEVENVDSDVNINLDDSGVTELIPASSTDKTENGEDKCNPSPDKDKIQRPKRKTRAPKMYGDWTE